MIHATKIKQLKLLTQGTSEGKKVGCLLVLFICS